MKAIKDEVGTQTSLKNEIDLVNQEIKQEEALVNDILINLVAMGEVKPGEEIQLGAYKVMPKVSVRFTQMKLDL